jgi:uncharacterized protein
VIDQVTIVKNEGAERYEINLDGLRIGLADYYQRGGVIVLPHTETTPAYGGRGFASRLIRFALEDIRAQGKMVDPACPFVADFIRKNPEYVDLLA